MKILETRHTSPAKVNRLLLGEHVEQELSRIEESVRAIVDSVRMEGDRALARFTEKFDGVTLRPQEFRVPGNEVRAANDKLLAPSLHALHKAHKKIVAFHEKHLRTSWLSRNPDGTVLGQQLTPIDRVGVYCPGGKAFYPSSVLMNIVPARVAGCRQIVMVSPPSSEGSIHPGLLAAANIAGATHIYRVGGAQAIAALAYGTGTVPKVDKIVGPGNIYVTIAKRLVTGRVAIDMEAGPSEVMIIADSSADPCIVAADILSQAEHDEMAVAILVTTSRAVVDRVLGEIKRQTRQLERRRIIRQSLRRNGLALVTRSMKEAIELVNLRAPEHLEIIARKPERLLKNIRNAGVIFLGGQTPNAVGDYIAGPNHVLPTGGRARFSSPLSAEDFRKVTNVVRYTQKQLKSEARDIIAIAELEGLTAHANAIRVRLKK